MEYYRVKQGCTHNDKWVTPEYPVTDESMLVMLSNGLATALGHTKPQYTDWGSGVYERNDKGEYNCVLSNWDSSD